MMLRRLSSNHPEFLPINFSSGMNLILADRAPDASAKHSRNARGKSSVLQAINYCLGANRPSPFKPLVDEGWSFTLELDLFDTVVTVTRPLKGGNRVEVSYDGAASQMIDGWRREDGTVSIEDWKGILGLALFGLDAQAEPSTSALSPRTLISYVLRLDAPNDPTKILPQQSATSSRSNIAFFLGLDWMVTHELSRLQQDHEAFKAIAHAKEVQLVPGLLPDESDLLLERTQTERELSAAQVRSDNFVVLEDPQGTVAQSNDVASDLTFLTDEQVTDERLLQLYQQSLAEPDTAVDDQVVGDVYTELGLVFSSAALRRFGEVQEFHRTLVHNRRRFLSTEIERLQHVIRDRAPEIEALNERRQVLARQLAMGGAVADLMELQRTVTELRSSLENLEEAVALVRRVQSGEDELKVRQATLVRDARERLAFDRSFVDRVNARFSEIIGDLYGRAASITVDVDHLGYKFTIKVAGSSSTGIKKMQLFAFDLTLMEASREDRHPKFLIHDSVVFDGVDPRQIASALTIAHQSSANSDAQYIVTMNTNDVPTAISSADWYEASVRRVVLDTEGGGAFGVVF
jgi:uncharacterized protein YydD (DUF2326 family)